MNTRRGMGRGFGIGYKNLVPIDSHIHSLSAKGCKTLNATYDLGVRYDSRNSFYGKARVEDENGVKRLYSYNTLVAEIDNGTPKVFGFYSQTTMRHIKEFLKQNGFRADDTKKILKTYGVKELNAKRQPYKIYLGDFNKLGGLMKTRKAKVYPYTKREKNISLATVGGAGVGFVVGGLTGGLVGMWAGVPIGTFVGNAIARKRYPQKGRKPYYKPSLFHRLTSPREDLLREREAINRIERARAKSERTASLSAKRKRR